MNQNIAAYCYTCRQEALVVNTNGGSFYTFRCGCCVDASTAPESGESECTGGQKADTGKPSCDLLSPIAMLGTAEVLSFGAKKYAAHNWRKGIAWSRIIGAILRHTYAIMAGEDTDKESGLLHADHLSCEVMFLQEFFRTRKDLDDRYKP